MIVIMNVSQFSRGVLLSLCRAMCVNTLVLPTLFPGHLPPLLLLAVTGGLWFTHTKVARKELNNI